MHGTITKLLIMFTYLVPPISSKQLDCIPKQRAYECFKVNSNVCIGNYFSRELKTRADALLLRILFNDNR